MGGGFLSNNKMFSDNRIDLDGLKAILDKKFQSQVDETLDTANRYANILEDGLDLVSEENAAAVKAYLVNLTSDLGDHLQVEIQEGLATIE